MKMKQQKYLIFIKTDRKDAGLGINFVWPWQIIKISNSLSNNSMETSNPWSMFNIPPPTGWQKQHPWIWPSTSRALLATSQLYHVGETIIFKYSQKIKIIKTKMCKEQEIGSKTNKQKKSARQIKIRIAKN